MVEGAGLEFQFTGNPCNVGSNPTLSARTPALCGRFACEGGMRAHVQSGFDKIAGSNLGPRQRALRAPAMDGSGAQNRRERFWTASAGPQGAGHGWLRRNPTLSARTPALRGRFACEGGMRAEVGEGFVRGSESTVSRYAAGCRRGLERASRSRAAWCCARSIARARQGSSLPPAEPLDTVCSPGPDATGFLSPPLRAPLMMRA